jgi:hypothetical protein
MVKPPAELISDAEFRKGRAILRTRLISGFIFALLIAAGAYSFIRTAQAVNAVKGQTSVIQRLTEESKGRGAEVVHLLGEVHEQGVTITALAERLKDCTTPEGACSQAQAKTAGTYVTNLQNSVLAGQAEELRRIGQLFTALGLTAAQVQQITNNFPTSAAAQKALASVPPAVTKTGGAPPPSRSDTSRCLLTVNLPPILRVDGTLCP